ncbi:UNVERIFIED_CONTAM: hypothetical protein HDU68_001717 [Siphonaria sp. JEL0065]|nr:hypothetical protein HDU68_001717 [Siphonaria sp. JEL0065]
MSSATTTSLKQLSDAALFHLPQQSIEDTVPVPGSAGSPGSSSTATLSNTPMDTTTAFSPASSGDPGDPIDGVKIKAKAGSVMSAEFSTASLQQQHQPMHEDSDNDSDFSGPSSASRCSRKRVTGERKKAGRKAITEEPKSKRVAQNRNAQRAFRERKEAYLHGLESKVQEQAARIEELERENVVLKQITAHLEIQPCAQVLEMGFQQQPSPFHSRINAPGFSNASPASTLVGESPQLAPPHQHQPDQTREDELFSFLDFPASTATPSASASTTFIPQTQQHQQQSFQTLETLLSLPPHAESTVPEFKKTMEILEQTSSTSLTPIRLPQLTVVQTALKQLPSLKNNTHLVDELCERFVAFTTKCTCQGLPYVDGVPVVTEEHRTLLRLKDQIVGTCVGGDVGKCEEIMDIARRQHRAHYERLVRHWDQALFHFVDFGSKQ